MILVAEVLPSAAPKLQAVEGVERTAGQMAVELKGVRARYLVALRVDAHRPRSPIRTHQASVE